MDNPAVYSFDEIAALKILVLRVSCFSKILSSYLKKKISKNTERKMPKTDQKMYNKWPKTTGHLSFWKKRCQMVFGHFLFSFEIQSLSFSLTSCFTKVKEPSLPSHFTHGCWMGRNHGFFDFSKGMKMKHIYLHSRLELVAFMLFMPLSYVWDY